MNHHMKYPEKRTAQHVLAKELVELAHGAKFAYDAEKAHKGAFSGGTKSFSLAFLRRMMERDTDVQPVSSHENQEHLELEQYKVFKLPFVSSSNNSTELDRGTLSQSIVKLPRPLVAKSTFPVVLRAAGLASSKGIANRLIQNKGIYVACLDYVQPVNATETSAEQSDRTISENGTESIPITGSADSVSKNSSDLVWKTVDREHVPENFIVEGNALVLRVGKSAIQICRILEEAEFEEKGLTCPGWEDFKRVRLMNKRGEWNQDVEQRDESSNISPSSDEGKNFSIRGIKNRRFPMNSR